MGFKVSIQLWSIVDNISLLQEGDLTIIPAVEEKKI